MEFKQLNWDFHSAASKCSSTQLDSTRRKILDSKILKLHFRPSSNTRLELEIFLLDKALDFYEYFKILLLATMIF